MGASYEPDNESPTRLVQVMGLLRLQTKGEFARWAGRSNPAVSDWFNGTTPIPLDVALRLRAEYKITLDWLYAGDESGMGQTLLDKLASYHPARRTVVSLKKRKA